MSWNRNKKTGIQGPVSKICFLLLVLGLGSCQLSKTERLTNKGIDAAAKGKFDKAERYFTRAIQADSSNLDAYFNRGSANNDMHYYAKAMEDYSYLRSKNYNNSDLYYNMGLNFYDLNKLDSALAAYTKAISMNSVDSDYYIAKGTALTDLKQYDKALKEYEQALKIKPDDVTALKDLGYTHYEMESWDLSRKYILEAIDKGLTEPDYFVKLAYCYDKLSDKAKACKYLSLAKELLKKGESLNNPPKLNCN